MTEAQKRAQAKYKAKNREKISKYNKEYYQKNVEDLKEKRKKYRDANKEQIKERNRISYLKRKENKNNGESKFTSGEEN